MHLHIPGDFEGEIHVHVESSGAEAKVLPPSSTVTETPEDVEEILERFETFDPSTSARAVHDALVARGWSAHAPASRNTGIVSKAQYVRLVFKGKKRSVSLFLNTQSLVYSRKDAAQFEHAIEGSEMRGTEALYMYHSEGQAQAVVDAVSVLESHANGTWPT